MKIASPEEFSAVSIESWITLRMKPMPTICIAMSFGMPNSEHPSGTRRSEPPATPDVPHAESVAMKLRKIAIGSVTLAPTVKAATSE